MTAKELIDKLSGTDPDAEVIGGLWNGRVDTYTVFDHANVLLYDRIYSDLFGFFRNLVETGSLCRMKSAVESGY